MNNPYADGTPGASAVSSPSSTGPSALEGERDVTRAPSAPRARKGVLILRLVVLIGVVFATVGLLLVGKTWLIYRAEHTVVSNQEKQEREFTRIHALVNPGIASVSDLDRVQAERDNTSALVKAAQANLAATESTRRVARVQVDGLRVREAGLDVFAAEVERAGQHLSLANAELAASVIRAPEDGWVAERIVEPGGSAKVGEPIEDNDLLDLLPLGTDPALKDESEE